MIRVSLIALVLALLAGCVPEAPPKTWTIDQCTRAELFQACLRALPAGPTATKYNDWDEVIEQCADAARYQSIRKAGTVKSECDGA
jgi:hypothetical protein